MPKTIGDLVVTAVLDTYILVANPACRVCKGTGKGVGTAPAIAVWEITKHPTVLADGFDAEVDCTEIKYCRCQKRVAKPDDWDLREMIDAAKEGEAEDAANH